MGRPRHVQVRNRITYRVLYLGDDGKKRVKTHKLISQALDFYAERMLKAKLNKKGEYWPKLLVDTTEVLLDGTPKDDLDS